MANSFQSGYTTQDESRATRGTIFPLVDIFEGGTNYLSFGGEPFTYPNGLLYNTLQFQDNFTKFTNRHTLTFGAYAEKYHSDNIFMNCCRQSAYAYNSLADFYTDANGYLANPNRTLAPITLSAFQISYSNIPGVEQPVQPLDVWYTAGYLQDEWRMRSNLSLTAGVRCRRVDVQEHRLQQPGRRCADLQGRERATGPVRHRRDAGDRRRCGRRASA